MITVGIDVGIENSKAVVLKDGNVLARGMVPSGGSGRAKAAEQVYQEVLQHAGLSASDVDKVVATGLGRWDVNFADARVVEPLADVKAALALSPFSRAVISLGADQARAVKFDAEGKVLQYSLNFKCAAGIGLFLESIALMLGMSLDEMSQMPAGSQNGVAVNDQCAALAELDVVSLIHDNVPRDSIVRAINEAMATKYSSMVHQLNDDIKSEAVLVGGVAANAGMVKAFKDRLGINLVVPDQPQYAGALGAAVIAAG
jgi:predicted CoA-substrate-specific enzyme activase